MPVNFPNSPTVGELFVTNGKTYQWDGEKWTTDTTVTKTDIGLSNVQNYSVANQAEAEAGVLDNLYMTPLKTKQAIVELSTPTDVSTEYAAGVIETNNDNNLNFWQGTQAEYDALAPQTYTKTSGFTSGTTYDTGFILPDLNSVNLSFTSAAGETSTITNGVFSGFGGMTYDDATKTVTINTGDGIGFTLHLAGSSPYTNSIRGYTTGGVAGTFYYMTASFAITSLTIESPDLIDANTLYFIEE